MKKLALLLILITLAFSHQAFACQCASNPPFLMAIKSERIKTIALIKIRRFLTYSDYADNTYVLSMEAEIEEVYKGDEKRKKITIWGTDGANCLEYLSLFQINKNYVVALSERGNTDRNYNLSNCGEHWLEVDEFKENVTGNIADDVKSMRLEALKSRLKNNQTVFSLLSFDIVSIFSFALPILY